MKKIRTRKDLEKLTIKQINYLISLEERLEEAEYSIRRYQEDSAKMYKERGLLQNRQQQALKNGLVTVEQLHEFDEIHRRNLENK